MSQGASLKAGAPMVTCRSISHLRSSRAHGKCKRMEAHKLYSRCAALPNQQCRGLRTHLKSAQEGSWHF